MLNGPFLPTLFIIFFTQRRINSVGLHSESPYRHVTIDVLGAPQTGTKKVFAPARRAQTTAVTRPIGPWPPSLSSLPPGKCTLS